MCFGHFLKWERFGNLRLRRTMSLVGFLALTTGKMAMLPNDEQLGNYSPLWRCFQEGFENA